MLLVGLTGGIACGKSTVSTLLLQAGIPLLDADKLAHDVVQPVSCERSPAARLHACPSPCMPQPATAGCAEPMHPTYTAGALGLQACGASLWAGHPAQRR